MPAIQIALLLVGRNIKTRILAVWRRCDVCERRRALPKSGVAYGYRSTEQRSDERPGKLGYNAAGEPANGSPDCGGGPGTEQVGTDGAGSGTVVPARPEDGTDRNPDHQNGDRGR